jgi:hypothetical protein
MPEFGSPFSGLAKDRKLMDRELKRSIRSRAASEYKAGQMCMQLTEFTHNNLTVEFLQGTANEERVHVVEIEIASRIGPKRAKFLYKGF